MKSAVLRWTLITVALCLTGTVLPVLFTKAVLYSGLAGRWFNEVWLYDLAVLGVVALCAAGGQRGLSLGTRAAVTVIALVLWCLALLAYAGSYVGGRVPAWVVVVAFLAASLWHFWLGWMTLWAIDWSKRSRIFVALAPLPILFAMALNPGEISGDEKLDFQWRFASRSRGNADLPVVRGPSSASVDSTQSAADFPQFLGPNRDGRLDAPVLDRDWHSRPPVLVWRMPVGAAWSSFSLVGDLAITQEQHGASETVVAYDLHSGERRWIHEYPALFPGAGSGEGPRATPTVADDRVYAVGATGTLHALKLNDGKPLWSANILGSATLQIHGACASPLVVDDLVVVCPSGETGPSLAAYRRSDGVPVWSVGEIGPSYASAMLATLLGDRVVLHIDGAGLSARRPRDGSLALHFPWKTLGNNITQPIVHAGSADQILLASFDMHGSTLLRIERPSNGNWTTQTIWTKPYMKSKFSTPVVLGPNAYGLDNGILACLEIATGKSLWKSGRYQHGQILLVGGLLVVLTEDGQLVLVDPQPSGLVELGRSDGLVGKSWNTLAMKGDLLVIRNAEQAACYRLATVESDSPQQHQP